MGRRAAGVAGIEAGIHPAGSMRRHADRILPVHELIVVRAGSLRITEEGRDFAAGAGEWLLLRAGRRHYGSADLGPDTWFYWICFDDSRARVLHDSPQWTDQTGVVARPDRLRRLFEDILDDQAAAELTSPAAGGYLELIVAEILRTVPARPATPAARLAARALRIAQARLAEPELSTSGIARELACSSDHLGRAFRDSYGETVTEYIHRGRVERARALFRSTELPIDAVAREAGFRDTRYFRRVFHRHVGLTPGDFRRLHPIASG